MLHIGPQTVKAEVMRKKQVRQQQGRPILRPAAGSLCAAHPSFGVPAVRSSLATMSRTWSEGEPELSLHDHRVLVMHLSV